MARRRLLFSLLFCLTSAATSPRAFAEAPFNGLVAYWPFAGDASAWGPYRQYDGTVFGPALVTDRHGVPNHAYHFDGNDYIDVPSSAQLKPPLPITISAWILLESGPTIWSVFTNEYRTDRYTGVWFGVGNAPPPVQLGVSYGDGGGPTADNRRTKSGSTPLSFGVWYHVAAVIRGATDMSLYVNGVDDGGGYSGTGGPMVYAGGPSSIGRKYGGVVYYFAGSMDDVYFYNRALSADEIMSLYLTGITLDVGPGSPHAGIAAPRVSPNPAQVGSRVLIDLGDAGTASVTIRDVSGRVVRQLTASGVTVAWDGCGERGEMMAPGMYLVRREGGHSTRASKLVLMR